MRTQLVVAEALRGLWPYVESTGAGRSGRDLLNTDNFAVEIKARRSLDIPAWLRQARKEATANEYPVLIFRPDGMGEATVDDWPVTMRLGDWRRLLAENIYEFGEPIE